MKKVDSAKKLKDIWKQVPVDYYDKGMNKNPLQKIWHFNKLRIFKKLTNDFNPEIILDIGCASGILTYEFSKIFPFSKVTGIDSYREAINYAKKKYPFLNFKIADAHKLPFNNNSFDLIICYETIEHVLNPTQVLKEIYRITKKNGTVLLAMDSGSLLFRTVWWIWEKTKGRVWHNAHLHPFRHNQLEYLIEQTKFKISEKRFSHLGMEVIFILKKISRETQL